MNATMYFPPGCAGEDLWLYLTPGPDDWGLPDVCISGIGEMVWIGILYNQPIKAAWTGSQFVILEDINRQQYYCRPLAQERVLSMVHDTQYPNWSDFPQQFTSYVVLWPREYRSCAPNCSVF